eukprot:scaffold229180_cov37-Tisochrysis_lutea.AAC.1
MLVPYHRGATLSSQQNLASPLISKGVEHGLGQKVLHVDELACVALCRQGPLGSSPQHTFLELKSTVSSTPR